MDIYDMFVLLVGVKENLYEWRMFLQCLLIFKNGIVEFVVLYNDIFKNEDSERILKRFFNVFLVSEYRQQEIKNIENKNK